MEEDQILGFDEQIEIYSKRVFNQDEMEKKMKNLNMILANIYPQTTILITQVNDHVYQLMFPLEIYGPLGLFQLEIQVDFEKNDIRILAYLADYMGRMKIRNKLLRLQVCRSMLRDNSNIRVGSFFLNPLHGFLGYNLQCGGLKKKLIFSTQIDEIEFGAYLKSLMLTAVNSFRTHFMKVLIQINKIKIQDLELYSNNIQARYLREQNWRKLPNQSQELLDRIKFVASKNMHLPFTKDEYDIYGPILSKQILNDQRVIQEIKPTQANDLNVEKNHKISEGGFCDIFAKDIFYTPVKEGNPQQVKRPLVIKQARDKIPDHIQRITKESQILQQLAQKFDFQQDDKNVGKKFFKPSGCCPYIAQFYFDQSSPEILLMERYYHQSLDYYKVKMQEVMSLSTRLFIAHDIAMALRYCHYYGVVHMDIKPGNVLIAKNMMAKLTDFGEAHQIFDPISNQYQDQKNIKSGRTFPYCAPEITKQDSVITTAYDIYCFGVLLFELIFDKLPIKENQKVFEERPNKLTYQVRYNERYYITLGPQKLMKYLGRMCLQCLQPNPAHRPQIDKIVLVLKDCLTYLNWVY